MKYNKSTIAVIALLLLAAAVIYIGVRGKGSCCHKATTPEHIGMVQSPWDVSWLYCNCGVCYQWIDDCSDYVAHKWCAYSGNNGKGK